MHEKLNVVITLAAAAIVALFSYIFFDSLLRTAISLIATIIVFFILGSIFKMFVVRGIEEVEEKEKEKQKEKENEENVEEEGYDEDQEESSSISIGE